MFMMSSRVKTRTQKCKLFNILRSKEGLILKLVQLIEYFIRKIFMKKLCRKCYSETSFRPLFNFGK